MSDQQSFREWAILEIMGHLRLAGLVSEATLAGAGVIRIDVPEGRDRNGEIIPAFTEFFGLGSLYRLTPVSEATARALASELRKAPVTRFDLPQLAAINRPTPEIPHYTSQDMGEDKSQPEEARQKTFHAMTDVPPEDDIDDDSGDEDEDEDELEPLEDDEEA